MVLKGKLCLVIITTLLFFSQSKENIPKKLSEEFRTHASRAIYSYSDYSWRTAFKVLDSLSSFDEKAVPYIIGFLDSLDQKDDRFLAVHLSTTIRQNPQFGKILLPSLLNFLKRTSPKKKEKYIGILRYIKDKKAIKLLQSEIKNENFKVVSILFDMKSFESINVINQFLLDEEYRDFWGIILANIPNYSHIDTFRQKLSPALIKILEDIESPEEAKIEAAKILMLENNLKGFDWFFRKVSYKQHLIDSGINKINHFFRCNLKSMEILQYFSPYLGDPNENFQKRLLNILKKSELSTLQKISTDSLKIEAIPINNKIFNVIKEHESKDKFYLISEDSIFEYSSGKIERRYKTYGYPRFCSAFLGKFVYGNDKQLWIQEGSELNKGFPKILPEKIYSVTINKDLIYVSCLKNVYVFDFSGQVIDIIHLEKLYFPYNFFNGSPVGYSEDKLYFFCYFPDLEKIGVKEFIFDGKGNICDLNNDGKMEVIMIKGHLLEIYFSENNVYKFSYKEGEEPKDIEFVDLNNDYKKEIVILTMKDNILIYYPFDRGTKYKKLKFPGNALFIHSFTNIGKACVLVSGAGYKKNPIIFNIDSKTIEDVPFLPNEILPEYQNGQLKYLVMFSPYTGYIYRKKIKL